MSIIKFFDKFTRGQENAQDNLNDNFEKLNEIVNDTGWLPLPITGEIAEAGSTTDENHIPKYRILNNVVYLRGSIKIETGKTGVITSLATVMEPGWSRMSFVQALVSTAVDARATIYANENGDLQLISKSGTPDIWLSGINLPID